MSTSPSAAVFSPIPQRTAESPASAAAPAAAQAAGYAAGWAQGVAAAAANERVALAEVAATAAAERGQLLTAALAALSALDAAAAQMRARTAPGVDEAVDVLASAAVDLAEVVVGQHVTEAGGAARGRAALDRALAAAPEHEDVVVRLNPADLALLDGLTGGAALAVGALATGGGRRSVELVADTGLRAGDAVADFPGGSVDARITTALGRMRAALRTSTREGTSA